jgi:hypothetical protein
MIEHLRLISQATAKDRQALVIVDSCWRTALGLVPFSAHILVIEPCCPILVSSWNQTSILFKSVSAGKTSIAFLLAKDFNIHYQNINGVHYIRDLCINRNNHQKPTFHPLGDFLNPALAPALGLVPFSAHILVIEPCCPILVSSWNQTSILFKSVSAGKTSIAFCLQSKT